MAVCKTIYEKKLATYFVSHHLITMYPLELGAKFTNAVQICSSATRDPGTSKNVGLPVVTSFGYLDILGDH